MCFGSNIVGSIFSTGSKEAPAPAPITSDNQTRQAAATDAQVAANESIAARRRRSSLLATGSAGGISDTAGSGSVLASGKTTLGQ